MEGKKNLCAMISTDLHGKIMAEKEQLELNTLAEYVERIFTEHFEGGQISMKAERTLAVQIPAELFERLKEYVACCGTSSIPVLEMLRQLPQLRQVYLCLDNDAAGHAASERMAKLLEERGISAERLVPQQKDWNDDLKAEQENKMERSELCQTFC